MVRDVAARRYAILIDAARSFPKDSKYYSDWAHYSNAGAEMMGEIVRRGLQPHLGKKEASN